MQNRKHYPLAFVLLACVLSMSACGGGGGGGGGGGDNDSDGDGVINSSDIDDDNDGLIEIASLQQLDWMRNDLFGTSLTDNAGNVAMAGCPNSGCNGYELSRALDFDTDNSGGIDSNDLFFDYDNDGQNNGWLPVGTMAAPFQANFNGNGQAIRNLHINRTNTDTETGGQFMGLFGVFSSAGSRIEINNLVLEDANVSGASRVGSLAGQVLGAVTITQCAITATVAATSGFSGGMAGELFGGTEVSDCVIDVQVSGLGIIGGLTGSATTFITIERVTTSGTVTATNLIGGGATGGLIGSFGGSTDPVNATITESHSSATVTGASNVGGLVGSVTDAEITDSTASGNVTGADKVGGLIGFAQTARPNLVLVHTNLTASGNVTGNSEVGGLIGRTSNPIDINNCSASGDVNGGSQTGGLVGRIDSGVNLFQRIEDCFATGAVTSTGDNVGGLIGYVEKDTLILTTHATGNVTGSGNNVGGLIGFIERASVNRGYATGDVNGGGNHTGGLVGLAFEDASVSVCYATGSVTGTDATGGLIGSANIVLPNTINPLKSDIGFCFSTGAVTTSSNNNYVGGLVGISYNLRVSNSFATSPVSNANRYVGGLIGDANTGTEIGIFGGNYAANTVTGNQDVGAIVGYSAMAVDGYTSFDGSTDNYFANNRGPGNAVGTNFTFPADINPTGTTGASLSDMQAVTSAGATGLFANFNASAVLWDFGSSSQLPGVIFDGVVFRDGDGDGVLD